MDMYPSNSKLSDFLWWFSILLGSLLGVRFLYDFILYLYFK